jgi:flagellar protein FliO/FliZ
MTMDWDIYLRTLLALVAVLALITGAAWAARRFGLAGARPGTRRKRRLSISEVLPIDARRRVILVQRDGVEHLLLVGGGSDIVVERGIREEGAEKA